MQFAGLQGDGYVRDGLLIRRQSGEVVDVAAGAYDTCQILGMDITYAETPDDELPESVEAFYAAAGDTVLELAYRGWHRGREVACRDLWPAVRKADRGNRVRNRQRRTIYVTRDGWNGEKVVAPLPESVVTPESRQRADDQRRRNTTPGDRPKSPKSVPDVPEPAGYLVQTDMSKLVFNTKLMSKLSRDTKAELRRLLTPRQYRDRMVVQVLAALRAQSRGLSSPESHLADTIRRELRWSEPDQRLQRLL